VEGQGDVCLVHAGRALATFQRLGVPRYVERARALMAVVGERSPS